MDSTKRPIQIPPEFCVYGEKHQIFELFKGMMEDLLLHKPEFPLPFLVSYLKQDNHEVPNIMILGPPASGKCTMSRLLAHKTRGMYLSPETLFTELTEQKRAMFNQYLHMNYDEIPCDVWVQVWKERFSANDVIKRGYVLDGFPTTREQALALQTIGISPNHCILLEAPDQVLLERAQGKRIDPETGDVYHTTFDWPTNPLIRQRLVDIAGYDEEQLKSSLERFHRNISGIASCYQTVLKRVNADQPKPDIFIQIHQFVSKFERSIAPFTPRILLLGPPGSGRSMQAALLASKYKIVNVCCDDLVKKAIVGSDQYSATIQLYLDRGMDAPDNIVVDLITRRLKERDCQVKGWVLHGFPLNTSQAIMLKTVGLEPNRTFFLEVPNDSIIERLILRMTDPMTGDRYHLLYNPPRLAEIRERLQRHPNDDEEKVRESLKIYQVFKEDLEEYYPQAFHINGDQDPHSVFETIESMIVNRLPKTFDQ